MYDISEDSFEAWRREVLENPARVVIAYFTAPWCGPCRMLKPTLEKLETENEGLTVVRIDVDSNSELAREFRIMSVPQMWFFQTGHLEETVTGIKPKPVLQQTLDELPQR